MKKSKINGLNIRSDSLDWRGAILSNLAYTPFWLGEILFLSAESAIQGIKFKDEEKRLKVFGMCGIDALKAGREVTNSITENKEFLVYWKEGYEIIYNSIAHRLLIAMFIHEKVRQNINVQQALLDTQGVFIYHEVGKEHPNTSLPEKFYIQVLLSQRDLLKKLINIS